MINIQREKKFLVFVDTKHILQYGVGQAESNLCAESSSVDYRFSGLIDHQIMTKGHTRMCRAVKQEAQLSPSDRAMRLSVVILPITTQQCRNYLYNKS